MCRGSPCRSPVPEEFSFPPISTGKVAAETSAVGSARDGRSKRGRYVVGGRPSAYRHTSPPGSIRPHQLLGVDCSSRGAVFAMRMCQLRLKNFQSFGPLPTEIGLNELTFLLGPNGAGKTAALLALARLFSPVPAMRRVQVEDFHVPLGGATDVVENLLWIEVDIEFEEAAAVTGSHASIPPFFAHMAMEAAERPPRVRIRLTATLEADGYIDEQIEYVTQVDADGEPTRSSAMSRHDRAAIEVHYLPARRDPVDHIAYTTASLLGRMLRAADWSGERVELARLTAEISSSMADNDAVAGMGAEIRDVWGLLHKGSFFKNPALAFGRGEIEGVLRQLTVTFEPGPTGGVVGFDRLSDGQQSLLYVSLVLAWQGIARKVLSGEETAFDPDRLRPPVHVVLAIEEPENSLAPHYLGRLLRQFREACAEDDAQVVVATHAPALLRRVEPEDIRFLRLSKDRSTTVRTVLMPADTDDAANTASAPGLGRPVRIGPRGRSVDHAEAVSEGVPRRCRGCGPSGPGSVDPDREGLRDLRGLLVELVEEGRCRRRIARRVVRGGTVRRCGT